MPNYRPDVDGLRAVAVMAVILFHGGFTWFSGGFTGVDVFFVISGYLITSIIVAELHGGAFTIGRFYERRVRRIFPALFLVIGVSAAAGYWLLMPSDFLDFGESVVFTAFFAANVLFHREMDYFAAPADLMPLLHTWSLAVEEQFYLLFPLILMFTAKWLRGRHFAPLLALFSLSLVASIYYVGEAPSFAFYFAHTRAWEFLLGAILALGVVPPIGTAAGKNLALSVGLALIGWSVVGYTPETPFPGAAALVPCIGAGLVIQSGIGGLAPFARHSLAWRPVLFTGLISYSLYLWHWPLFVFAKRFLVRPLTTSETLLIIGLTFVLSVLSWRYVERPFRGKRPRYTRRQVMLSALACLFLAAGVSHVLVSTRGLPGRLSAEVAVIDDAREAKNPAQKACFNTAVDRVKEGRLCRFGASEETPSFLLWGDSHADAIMPGVGRLAGDYGVAGVFAGIDRCPPLAGVAVSTKQVCREFNDAVLAYLLAHTHIEQVMLVARWARYAEGTPYAGEDGDVLYLSDDASAGSGSLAENRRVFAAGMQRTIETLVRSGKKVRILAQVPEVGHDVPSVLALSRHLGLSRTLGPSLGDYRRRQTHVMDALKTVAAAYPVEVAYPHELLCTGQRCQVERDGVPLYRDDDHLSVFGAELVGPLLAPAVPGTPQGLAAAATTP